MQLRSKTNNDIFQLYHSKWLELGEGVAVPTSIFLESDNIAMCDKCVDIITSEDNYVPSQLWVIKHSPTERDSEIISNGVTKALTLYKAKSLDSMIKQINRDLKSGQLSEEETREILQRLVKLNKIKVKIAKQLKRLIL